MAAHASNPGGSSIQQKSGTPAGGPAFLLAGGPGLLGAAPLALRAARALRVRWLRYATHSNLPGPNPGDSSIQQKSGTPVGGPASLLAGGPGLLGAAPLALRAARALRVRWLRCATHSNLSGSNPGGSSTQQKNGTPLGPRFFVGWGTRIRTWVDGVRVRSPTARRSPKKRFSAWRTGSRGGPCGDRPSCARPCAHHGSRTRPCAGCPAVRRRIPSTPG